MAKTAIQQHNPELAAIIAIPVVLAALWLKFAAPATSWALRQGYFTTSRPLVSFPGAYPRAAGPTLLTVTALAAIALGIAAAVIVGLRMAAPVQHDPDDRRPVPPVAAPVLAATALTGGLLILALIPLVPDPIAAAASIVAAYGLADLLTEKLRERRERARDLNEIEWALYPYLGYDELPRRRVVAITEWDQEIDNEPGKPKTILLAYRGRREELKPQLNQRLDDAVGSHYSLAFATTDQLITASLTSPNSESELVRGLREHIASKALFDSGATVIIDPEHDYGGNGDLIRFTVRHKIGSALAGTDRLRLIARKISDLGLPGRWRCIRNDNLSGTATFEMRTELPTRVYPPIRPAVNTVEEACQCYERATIPLAVDEEEALIEWNLKVNPHMLLMGPTGTGKTALIHNALVNGARLGCQIFIIDFKGGEFTAFRDYPNVVSVITEPHEAAALVATLHKEMRRRYNLYKRNKRSLANEVPFMIIFDEYAEFQEAMKSLYASTGGKGACPTIQKFSSILRLARTARLHCVAALQRADQKFLEGEAKDNFTMRVSLGKLSSVAAQMIHNDANAGRTIPIGIRGRGTALSSAGVPTEVQTFYVPDLDDPGNEEEQRIVEELRPAVSLYERGVIMPPDTDPITDPQTYAIYEALPLLKAAEYPQFDPASPKFDPPQWLSLVDDGVDSIFGSAPDGPRTPVTAQELVSAYDNAEGENRHVAVAELEVGDYMCHPDTREWAILDEEPIPGENPETTTLILRDVFSGEREETEVASGAVVAVRDLPETHLAPA
ncbi:DNA translocase FtsK [Mycobacterium marinum]|uniref:FtsK/SpoIIIE domain-containing protein n=1 Tax=Mycobacterium marinum TaxID=1781 RepID=UPI000ECF338A|nr:FtsK/SpoIIIE domain-containing protein [Mycobacterium marinum]RFZ07577.1 DNA translocase FtsK [Mycobacterium marinum]